MKISFLFLCRLFSHSHGKVHLLNKPLRYPPQSRLLIPWVSLTMHVAWSKDLTFVELCLGRGEGAWPHSWNQNLLLGHGARFIPRNLMTNTCQKHDTRFLCYVCRNCMHWDYWRCILLQSNHLFVKYNLKNDMKSTYKGNLYKAKFKVCEYILNLPTKLAFIRTK